MKCGCKCKCKSRCKSGYGCTGVSNLSFFVAPQLNKRVACIGAGRSGADSKTPGLTVSPGGDGRSFWSGYILTLDVMFPRRVQSGRGVGVVQSRGEKGDKRREEKEGREKDC
jgi:hypothetical protein